MRAAYGCRFASADQRADVGQVLETALARVHDRKADRSRLDRRETESGATHRECKGVVAAIEPHELAIVPDVPAQLNTLIGGVDVRRRRRPDVHRDVIAIGERAHECGNRDVGTSSVLVGTVIEKENPQLLAPFARRSDRLKRLGVQAEWHDLDLLLWVRRFHAVGAPARRNEQRLHAVEMR